MVVTSVDWWEALDEDVRNQLKTILDEVTAERNAAVLEVDNQARQAIIDAGTTIVELTDEQRAAWVDAMKPVWAQFEEEVGADNIAAAQTFNE